MPIDWMQKGRRWALALALALGTVALNALAQGAAAPQSAGFITLASTTSTEQSGLFGHLLPRFRQDTGIDVRVVALGTGQALDAARRGDADAVLVHDLVAEERFVADGFATERRPVMYNDFVVIGPVADPARAKGNDIAAGLARVAAAAGPAFISRGDKSGTHAAELRMWQHTGVQPTSAKPAWYRECGCGMGPALNMAAATGAYVLADRGTWLAFASRGNRSDLAILVEGDRRLFNPYGVMVVNPARHPHVKAQAAQRFADWLVGKAGQEAIASYRIGGQQLFFPNADR